MAIIEHTLSRAAALTGMLLDALMHLKSTSGPAADPSKDTHLEWCCSRGDAVYMHTCASKYM